MIMDVYNGARTGTVTKGETLPMSSIVISSNIPPLKKRGRGMPLLVMPSLHYTLHPPFPQWHLIHCRYQSRCLMINFGLPSLDIGMAEYIGPVGLWKQCSSCAGFCCALGDQIFDKGIDEIEGSICPMLRKEAPEATSNRVL